MAKIDKFTMNDLKFPTKETRDKLNQLVECVNGKADNVCVWHNVGVNDEWIPSCAKESVFNVFGIAWFEYCPYCGRKIKVVKDGRD